ncbi:protoporphyrinogen oxidase HemJ [Devosia algicola]|uniref:Protoporphyrinogen IX oxidase n=1 Tax=Devosia algicola TaxID=3026418 RepID=A0ABY7YL43_9HYPH|nr:protoporphyrinogen oxidase HemJ [Devosia algicola]WDR01794.1 protoporphyrinogen oxidase HemJ [Devosia algicola]
MEWVKAAHVISVIAWMAGMLYLPRLFVYHADAEIGSVQSETFKIMERRLLRGIINPAMIATFIFGLWMIAAGFIDWSQGWPWVKAFFVLVLSAFHGHLAGHFKRFAKDANQKPAKYFRLINEVPTVAMIIIVIMVIVRPF